MRKRPTGPVTGALTALCLAAVVLLAGGCGSGADGQAGAADATSSASAATTGPEDHTAAARTPSADAAPAPEPTLATGSLTEKEKEYLTERLPKGVDPAAILEAGQEACDRIGLTAARDFAAAVAAVREGDADGVRDAITDLCPKYAPLLEAAGL
ncbi:hypothetical protein [Streptomyces sp. NPDC089919]|uniref:hypothetical protein n=1 Tax=Streptomyces sp. NPDC089919 TaxID=3155188 RepID=UPI0034490665